MEAYISEVTAKELANEIPLHIYEFPVDDQTKKYEGVYKICSEWKRKNSYMPIAYHQSTIVALEPVKNNENIEPLTYVKKTIDFENPFEKTLLEKIIKDSLLSEGQKKLKLKRVGNYLQKRDPIIAGQILIYPALSFHVNVVNNRIHIGFNMTHKFEYDYTLQQMIERGQIIQPGLKIVHSA